MVCRFFLAKWITFKLYLCLKQWLQRRLAELQYISLKKTVLKHLLKKSVNLFQQCFEKKPTIDLIANAKSQVNQWNFWGKKTTRHKIKKEPFDRSTTNMTIKVHKQKTRKEWMDLSKIECTHRQCVCKVWVMLMKSGWI